MKNNKGMTLIELIVSIVLLSIILVFLHTLVNNLVFNEMDKEYDDNVMRDLLIDNIQENLIHFGLAYANQDEIDYVVNLSEDKKTITINTLIGKSLIVVSNENNKYEILYNNAYGKNAIWELSENLIVDIDNISIEKGNANNKGNMFLKIVIPIYEIDKENIDNNNSYNDFIINYYGKLNHNSGIYIDPDDPEEEGEENQNTFSDYLISNAALWQSNLEGDGYRYVGSGAIGTSTNPNNFICFGTTSKSDCTTNQDKYMYRILGIFPDASEKEHLKLIKYKQLGSYAWDSSMSNDISWENSDMYKGLNGDYFLTNTTFDYLQNTVWLNKIENWTWSAVNTETNSNSGPNYYNSVNPKEIYLHEMNRGTKTTKLGSWTTPSAKIGLMYASDYTLSLGSNALALTTGLYTNRALLKTGWIHQSNNDTTKDFYEWTLSCFGDSEGIFYAWDVPDDGRLGYVYVDTLEGVRPVFYLTHDTKYVSGIGKIDDPYILLNK